MKKSIIVMMVAVLLMSALFVSCKQEIATPQDSLGTVLISLPSSRDLIPDAPQKAYPEVTSWWYVATKTDSGYYKSGETEWHSLTAMQAGQDVGEFSLGTWEFSFYGYATAPDGKPADPKANAVYYAENIEKTVLAGNNTVDVELEVGAGVPFRKLTIHNIEIPAGLTLKLSIDGGTEDVITQLPYEIALSAEGVHTYELKVYSGLEPVGSGKTSVNVSRGYNYGITGSIEWLDQKGVVIIGTVTYREAVATSASTTVSSGQSAVFTTSVAPNGNETTVTFPAGVLSEGTYTLTTTVSGYEDVGSFVVASGNPVAAIDLSTTAPESSFDQAVTVVTYIAKGLSNVEVYYNGTGANPTDVSYNGTTGELSFKTTHFSQFVVTSSDEIIVSDGTKYASLADFRDAVNTGNSFAGKTVYLMKNVILSGEWEPIGRGARYQENPVVFSGTFDGKGYTITGLISSGYEPSSYVADHSEYTAGLFGYVKNGTVKNVRLSGVAISQSTSVDDTKPLENAGAVVGYLEYGTVENCAVLSGTVSGYNGIGGVVGRAYGVCTIENCSNAAAVSGKKNVAGIVGFVNPLHNGTIKVSTNSNSGSVTRTAVAGKEGAGAAAGIVCYGCSDNKSGASGSVYIQGNTSESEITDEGGSRAAAIHYCTSHGPSTTTGRVDVQEQGILGTAEPVSGFPTENPPLPM